MASARGELRTYMYMYISFDFLIKFFFLPLSQFFSVMTLVDGWRWTVNKSYEEFMALHKSVS